MKIWLAVVLAAVCAALSVVAPDLGAVCRGAAPLVLEQAAHSAVAVRLSASS
jgi:hypothetical protein